jgi:gluconolactonase
MSPSFNSVLAPSSEVKRHSVVATTKESRVPLPRISRRRFLQASLAAAGWAWSGLPLHGAISYENLRTDDYLGPVQVLTQLSGKPFTEGPAADRDGNLYFTNVPVNQILKWEVSEKRLSVFRSDSNEANGLLFDREGRLLACEGGTRRVTRTDMKTGRIEVLADQYQGKPLAKPNDLCLDREGRVYFTSRSAVDDPADENPKGVYRLDPDGRLERVVTYPEMHMPNGIDLSPDGKQMYIIDAHPGDGFQRNVRVYDVDREGNLSGGRVLIDFSPGRSGDGMCVDSAGNLYIAAGLHKPRGTSETLATRPGIHVFSPAGQLLGFRETPEDTITNCTFGGPNHKTLFVTCGSLLLSLQT